MKRWVHLLCVCALLLAAGCGGGAAGTETEGSTSQTRETLRPPDAAVNTLFGIPYYAASFGNPIFDASDVNRGYYNLLFDALVRLDSRFSPEPYLCRDWVQEGNTLTLSLRQDARFHDGTPVTAADVVYSLNLARSHAASAYRARFACITAVSASGPYAVALTVTAAPEAVVCLLDIPVIKTGTGNGTTAVGSGRYLRVEDDEDAYFIPNAEHFENSVDRVEITHIMIHGVENMDGVFYGVTSGYINMLLADPMDTRQVSLRGNADIYPVPTPLLYYFGFRTNGGVFAHSAVRAAAAALIDSGALCADALNGRAEPAEGLFHPALSLDAASRASTAGTPDAFARAVLAAGSYYAAPDGTICQADGTVLRLRLLISAGMPGAAEAAAYVSEKLAAAGVSVTTEVLAGSAYTAALTAGKHDLYFAVQDVTAAFDFTALLSSGGTANYGKYKNSAADEILANLRAGGVQGAVLQARQLQAVLDADAPIVPVGYKIKEVWINRRFAITGVRTTAGDIFYNVFYWNRAA